MIEWKETPGPYIVNGLRTVIVLVAAFDKNTAEEYVFQKLGLHENAVWIMNAVYPTIYSRDGSKPEPIQATILYNAHIMKDNHEQKRN